MKKQIKIEKILLVLFILTIVSLWLGLGTVLILTKIAKIPGELFTKYSWGMWFWLPIPILSIILGIKYKQKGINCTKNIIGGFIIGIIGLIFGSYFLLFNFEVDYSEIYNYEQIIGLEIPSEGILEKQIWDESYLLEHITNYAKFTNAEEIRKFEEELQNSNNWLFQEQISSHLSIFIPLTLVCNINDICYYSVYIEGIDDYNIIPNESGKYHIYAMMYSTEYSTLKIEDYILEYKN